RGREKSRPVTAARSDFGDVESVRPRVRGWSGGVRATGGSIPWLDFEVPSPTGGSEGVGPVFEGESDRARSAACQHCNFGVQWIEDLFEVDIPALRACLSFLAWSISFSALLARSASSWPCLEFKLAIRARNWSTDSEPSLDASIVAVSRSECSVA